jgi:hypothetical protein
MAMFGPRRMGRARRSQAVQLVARACLAGMKLEKHQSVSRRWKGPSHTVWSTTIDGVTIYRISRAALARIYLETLP